MKFTWLSDEVKCDDPKHRKRSRTFYRCCALNGQSYDVGDYAVVETSNVHSRREICKILCMFESQETGRKSTRYCASVRWYTWAKNLKAAFRGFTQATDEVVEDLRQPEEVIGLESLIQKCHVFFAMPDDPDCSHMKFGDLYFPCRYKLTDLGLVPIISMSMSPQFLEDIERAHLTPHSKKSKCEKTEETIVILNGDAVTTTPPLPMTPQRKICCKRNLNESFGSSQELLSYSIIDVDELQSNDESSIKLKLRVSCRQLRDESAKTPTRKSTRVVKRVAYAECVTPTKKTPSQRRGRSNSLAPTETQLGGNRKIISPLKRNRTRSASSEERTPTTNSSSPRKIRFVSSRNEVVTKNVVCRIERLNLQQVDEPKKSRRRDDEGAKTPRARVKLLREGLITPSMEARATPVKANTTPLDKARARLHVSFVPNALPCREREFSDIYRFIEGKLSDRCGGCMYVSGVPGTGKTATVTDVIKQLQALAKANAIAAFKYVNLNGMKLTEPRQSYVEILKQLTGRTLAWEQAQNALDVRFTKAQKKCEPIVLVVDELDILCTKRQDVVYNLLDWPSRANMPLIIITIANTMDLPERLLMGRVTSRLGLTRLTFQAYTHKQLQEIVTKRLVGTEAFNPDAIQLVARKVASVSGDARRALDICRRAAEIANLENGDAQVSMSHVNEALNAMITQPKVKAIKHCSRLQQLILQAVVAEVERTGVEETTFSEVFTMLVSVASLDGFQMVSSTAALRAVSGLGACRLLLLDQKSGDVHRKIILNVSPDDVYYALRRD